MKLIRTMKSKLIFSHLIILLAAMLLFESFLIFLIKRYYYDNITQLLKKQIEISANTYTSYLSGNYSAGNHKDPMEIFTDNTTAQVQLMDSAGRVIDDSEARTIGEKISSEDVVKAQNGFLGICKGSSKGIPSISVSSPVTSDKSNIKIIRFTSSLKGADTAVGKIIVIMLCISIIIIIIAAILSILISSTITKPLIRIKDAAEELASGKLDTMVSINSRDEIGQLAETFNLMASRLNEHEQLKNEFISSISHELRTPLTSIKGWTQTLRFSDLEEKSEILEGLNIIENETNRLTEMVNELLDISRFQSGRILLRKTKVDINSLLKYLYKHLLPRAEEKGITLTIDSKAKLTSTEADEDRLLQALLNILDNSLKFTGRGGFIRITLESDEKSIIITIEDNGCGIEASELEMVTEKFYKGSKSKNSCGLGLAICREIIALHNGDLKIFSTPQVGTSIQIFLPL